MPPTEDHIVIKRLLEENAKILNENNILLKKLHRNAVTGMVLQVIWYALLIGIPFALYFILQPYFDAFGSSYDNFIDGLNELPGLKGIEALLHNSTSTNE